MQNVEYKSELRDPSLARTICGSLNAIHADTLVQTDTYFRVPDAKLKKRETVGRPTEYIFYTRASRTRPKLSNFTIYSERQAQDRFGTTPMPVLMVVKKSRELWVYQGVRIHLDQVEGLGWFIEFEALVTPERNLAKCHELMDTLRRAFNPALGEAIAVGYVELLSDQSSTPDAREHA
jgi:adenylate cyclase, class 2